jgi:hypothetical protein
VSTEPPRIYEATLESGLSGWVLRGADNPQRKAKKGS